MLLLGLGGQGPRLFRRLGRGGGCGGRGVAFGGEGGYGGLEGCELGALRVLGALGRGLRDGWALKGLSAVYPFGCVGHGRAPFCPSTGSG